MSCGVPRNTTQFWSDRRVAGLSCLCADFVSHTYAPHRHDALVVAVTEVGGSEFKSRGRTQEATTARLLVFNPDEPHSGRMGRSERWRYRGLYLTEQALEILASSLGVNDVPYFTSNVFDDADLIGAFLDLHRTLQESRDAFLEHELLAQSFGRLFSRYGDNPAPIPMAPQDRRTLSTAQELMQERHEGPLTLEDISGEINLTPFQLIGLFKRTIGLTPHAYLTHIRLEATIRRMLAGEGIAEAAIAAGFYDQSALTNHFKAAYGITPRQWLKAVSGH